MLLATIWPIGIDVLRHRGRDHGAYSAISLARQSMGGKSLELNGDGRAVFRNAAEDGRCHVKLKRPTNASIVQLGEESHVIPIGPIFFRHPVR